MRIQFAVLTLLGCGICARGHLLHLLSISKAEETFQNGDSFQHTDLSPWAMNTALCVCVSVWENGTDKQEWQTGEIDT